MFGKSAAPLAWVWRIAERLCTSWGPFFLWLAWEGGKWLKVWQRKICCFFLFCSEQLLLQTRQRILYNYSLFAYTARPDGRKNKLSPRFRQKPRRCRTSSFLTVWEANVQTCWVTLWWDEREVHLFPGRRIRAESCGAAGSRTAISSQGQQMTAANWKTNEVNKSNLDSGVAVYLCVETEEKLHKRLWIYFVLMQFSHILYWPRFWLV